MAQSILSNIFSLKAQRQLDESTRQVATATTRLSSGQRINTAADDAAGLAISLALNSDTRVLAQAYRNANDGVSAINIASSALESFTSILTRQKELAVQASNQTYSRVQRLALQNEADALTNEFNRIASSVEFNGRALFDPNSGTLSVQLGKGNENYLATAVGTQLNTNAFTGTFLSPQTSTATGSLIAQQIIGDINRDTLADIIFFNDTADTLNVMLGNADGSFQAASGSVSGVSGFTSLTLVDFNNDGAGDVVGIAGTRVEVFIGNGNGTFRTGVTYTTTNTNTNNTLLTGDFNGDGKADVAVNYGTVKVSTDSISVLYGNGDGTLQSGVRITGVNNFLAGIGVGDFNTDGIDDIIGYGGGGGSTALVFLGNSNGTFSGGMSSSITNTNFALYQDFNRDGFIDILATQISLDFIAGNGDGTFKAGISVVDSTMGSSRFADINGDGLLDLYKHSGSDLITTLGNGDGTFKAVATSAIGYAPAAVTLYDLNRDGALDLIGRSSGSLVSKISQTIKSASVPYLNLSTQAEARSSIDTVERALERVRQETGVLGASQSRLFSAINSLTSTRAEYEKSLSRIVDADIGEESANLTLAQIKQRAASAVMAQANIQPTIALKLLS